MDLSEFAVDPETYENGKKVEFGDGAYIRVRAMGSEHAQKVRDKIWAPYVTWKEVPDNLSAKLNARWIVRGLLTEMVGFTLGGKPVKFDPNDQDSQEGLIKDLAEPRYKPFRTRVLTIAASDTNYQAAQDEALEKN